MDESEKDSAKKGVLIWLGAVLGWLVCAGICLLTSIGLETYPDAYDMLFPAVLLMLFGNVFVFLFIISRWGNQAAKFFGSIIRICVGEGLLLAGLYALGKYALGS